jgi:hypothetical protein
MHWQQAGTSLDQQPSGASNWIAEFRKKANYSPENGVFPGS